MPAAYSDRQEYIIKKEGGIFAQKRNELKESQIRIDSEITAIENQLRDLCADVLPFMFAESLSKKLKESLLKEESVKNDFITKTNIKRKITKRLV